MINTSIEKLEKEANKLQGTLNDIKKKIKILEHIKNTYLNIKVQEIHFRSCECTICAVDSRFCGKNIRWVAGPTEKELPVKVEVDSKKQTSWWLKEEKQEEIIDINGDPWFTMEWGEPWNGDNWWGWGSTIEDAIINYFNRVL